MEDLDIKDFQQVSSVSDTDNLLLVLATKTNGKMTVGLFRSAIKADITPAIKDGQWWIGSVNTEVDAEGKTPELRNGELGIEWKYTTETAWRLLVEYEKITLKFKDLTPEEKASIKGDPGEKGDPLTYGDLTPEQKAELKGEDGKDGIDGIDGINGINGKDGDDGKSLMVLPNGNIAYWDDATQQWVDTGREASIKGDPGEKGDPLTYGDLTPEQKAELKGETGKDGIDGKDGEDGKSLRVLANGNIAYWDEDAQEWIDTGKEAAATVDIDGVEVAFTEAPERTLPASGDTIPTVFGKLLKWLKSLGKFATAETIDWAADVSNKPEITSKAYIDEADTALSQRIDTKASTDYVDQKNNAQDTRISENAAAITLNAQQIQALLGAVVYLGNIARSTAELEADTGQALLSARADELISEQGKPALQRGYTLVDADNNDWWYDGALWINIGYSAVSIATNLLLGVVKGSTKNLHVTILANGEMQIVGLADALQAKANDSEVLHLAGAETVTGAKTFAVSPVVPAPTANGHATPKSYIDGLVGDINSILDNINGEVI